MKKREGKEKMCLSKETLVSKVFLNNTAAEKRPNFVRGA